MVKRSAQSLQEGSAGADKAAAGGGKAKKRRVTGGGSSKARQHKEAKGDASEAGDQMSRLLASGGGAGASVARGASSSSGSTGGKRSRRQAPGKKGDYSFRKRVPLRPDAGANDIYVTRKRKLAALVQRALKVLDPDTYRLGETKTLRLHATGAALLHCAKLALLVERHFGGDVTLRTETGTATMFDDFEPRRAGIEPKAQRRETPKLCITVRRCSKKP